MGLSLTDHYWIRPQGSEVCWGDVNFFANGFSDDMGNLLFGRDVRTDAFDPVSPDNTSEGMLMKRWSIIDGSCYLIKAGELPYRQEAYNEKAACILAERMGIPHVEYDVIEYNGVVCSICDGFIDEDTELVSAHQISRSEIHEPGVPLYDHLVSCCLHHRLDAVPFLDRMIVTDFLLANEDRHLYNLGLIRDAGTLEFIGPAPIYDCGSSLGYNRDVPDMAVAAGAACKPFAESFEKELDLVTDFGWVDADGLDGALQEARAFLLECEGLDPERADAMSGTIEARIEALRSRL